MWGVTCGIMGGVWLYGSCSGKRLSEPSGMAFLLNVTHTNDASKSSAGARIKGVEYQIDGKGIGYSSTPPFDINYSVNGLADGKHVLTFIVNGTDGDVDASFTYNYDIAINPRVDMTLEFKNDTTQLRNGEDLQCVVRYDKANTNLNVNWVKTTFALDGIYVGEVAPPSEVWNYELKDLSKGKHNFLVNHYFDGEISGVVWRLYKLEVVE